MTYLTGEARHAAIDEALRLRAAGLTYEAIAEQMGCARGKVAHLLRDGRARATGEPGKIGAPSSAQEQVSHQTPSQSTQDSVNGAGIEHESDIAWTPAPDFVRADAKRDALRQYLGTTWQARRVYVSMPTKTRTVAAVGDWHGNIDPAILAALIEVQADEYVVGGDAFDARYASSWAPNTPGEAAADQERGFRQELASNRAALETLLDNTAGVVRLFLGNHDIRAWRAAYDALPGWVLFHWQDPFAMLLEGLGDRASVVGHDVKWHFPGGSIQDTGHNDEFMYVMGDALFSHMNFVGGATETGVSKLWRNWLTNWRYTLGLDRVRVIVHFHVHARNLHSRDGGHMLLIEPGMGGCVSGELYKAGYNGKWRPGVQGFVVLRQYKDNDDWRTDLGSVEMIAPKMSEAVRVGR